MIAYGLSWPENYSELNVEIDMIRARGKLERNGKVYGEGLFHHYRRMFTLLWPEDDHHRWSDLGLKRKTEKDIVVMMGSGDSNKTYLSSKYVLCNWWVLPYNTLWMISSTEARGAELRNWGAIKGLFNRARERFPWLPGVVLESKYCITPDNISEGGREGRTLTRGIIFIPCKKGGAWVGMGAYAGIKPPKGGRLGHFGDEVSFMHPTFLNAYANWFGKAFEAILDGNPTDLDDPLCIAAKPPLGWETWKDNGKTQEWESSFYNAWVIAFDGRDSPNMDYPKEGPIRFPYLISYKKHDAVLKLHGPDHPLYWQQCVGKPLPGAEKFRVIPHSLPDQCGAYASVVWEGADLEDIVSLDAAYGGEGGDRCILTHIRYGLDVEGRNVIELKAQVNVPISLVNNLERADIQIARFCKNYCEGYGIPPKKFYFDGRSTLAIALAEVWSSEVNVVDFGGPATKRPVSQDEFVTDEQTGAKRLKRCDEHYSKFVTELWFTVYYLMIGKQARNLTKELVMELRRRIWKFVARQRIEVETKEDMKKRTSESPDMGDSYVIAVEGARREGFLIALLKENVQAEENPEHWLDQEIDNRKKFLAKHELKHV
jgi:hypothetical protein